MNTFIPKVMELKVMVWSFYEDGFAIKSNTKFDKSLNQENKSYQTI